MAEPAYLEDLSKKLLEKLDALFGLHPGFRPVHAKGVMCSGTFTPSAEAATLTKAPHAQRQSTPVILRFSDFAGIPTISDTDPNASPRGIALRFNLAPHVHTDIIGHTHNGFPTRTGEEFVDVLRALIESQGNASKPTPFEKYLDAHPKAKEFFTTPNPIPSSFSRDSYFAVTAFKFTNKDNQSCYGRFQILPQEGNDFLAPDAVSDKGSEFLFEELEARLKRESIKMRVVVEIAPDGAEVNDATIVWPANCRKVEFGLVELTARVPSDDAEANKIIFDPIPRVDGIEPSDDPLIELRAAIYLMTGRRRRAAAKH